MGVLLSRVYHTTISLEQEVRDKLQFVVVVRYHEVLGTVEHLAISQSSVSVVT